MEVNIEEGMGKIELLIKEKIKKIGKFEERILGGIEIDLIEWKNIMRNEIGEERWMEKKEERIMNVDDEIGEGGKEFLILRIKLRRERMEDVKVWGDWMKVVWEDNKEKGRGFLIVKYIEDIVRKVEIIVEKEEGRKV